MRVGLVLVGLMRVGLVLVGLAVTILIGLAVTILIGLAVTILIGLMRVGLVLVRLGVAVLVGLVRVGLVLGGLGVGVVVLGGVLVVGVLGVLVAVVVCGVVFLVGLVRRGLVCLGLVAVARRVSSVVCLAVGGVVLRLGVGVRVLGGILIGLVRVGLVLGGLGVGVVVLGGVLVVGVLGVLVAVVVCGVVFLVGLVRRGLVCLGLVAVARRVSSVVCLAVGGVVLRLGVSVRVLDGIVPMLRVGIGLTGAICVAGVVASLAGVGSLIRVGGRRVCCMLSAMRLLVDTQGVPGRSVLLGCGRRVGGAVSTMSCPGGVTVAGGGISARNAVRITGGHARISTVRPLRRGRRTTVGASISTNMTAALARGGASSVRSTRRIAYAATDISGIADAVCAVTCMSCIRSEIGGAAESVRSVADTARIAAAEGTSALVGSLSAHAGLATTNACADKLIGTARLTVSAGRAVIQVGRVLPVLNAEKIVIVPIRSESVRVSPGIVGIPLRLPANCKTTLRPNLVKCQGTIGANTVRSIRFLRRLPATCCSRLGREVITRRGTIGATAAGTTCGFDRMVLAVGNLVGITGLEVHMIQTLLVAASVRIDLVRRGAEIGARTGKYLVRISGLLLRNSLSRCTALTHTVVAHGSSGRTASSTVARSPAVRASSGCAGGRSAGCGGAMCASRGRAGSGGAMSASRGCTGSGGAMSASCRCAGSGCTMCASRGCAGCRGSVGASRGRAGVA